jgi:hypothetical protein
MLGVLADGCLRARLAIRPSVDGLHVIVETDALLDVSGVPVRPGIFPREHEILSRFPMIFDEEHVAPPFMVWTGDRARQEMMTATNP